MFLAESLTCIKDSAVIAHNYTKMLVRFKKSPYLCSVKRHKKDNKSIKVGVATTHRPE